MTRFHAIFFHIPNKKQAIEETNLIILATVMNFLKIKRKKIYIQMKTKINFSFLNRYINRI